MMNDEPPMDLFARTMSFAVRIVSLYGALPKSAPAAVIGRQFLRSGTSVGAQYREARRARSTAEFISKLESALQELDETCYWLELLVAAKIMAKARLAPLLQEANELIAILVASVKTAKRSRQSKEHSGRAC
jgi:four helix bundle protein